MKKIKSAITLALLIGGLLTLLFLSIDRHGSKLSHDRRLKQEQEARDSTWQPPSRLDY